MAVKRDLEGRQVDVNVLVTRARAARGNQLKSLVSQGLKNLSYHVGLYPVLQRFGTREPAILFYHKVQRRPVGGWGEPVLAVEDFERHVAFLAREYRPLHLSELVAGLQGRVRLPERAVALTFDDGYRNNLYLAAPILRHYRVPATLFVSTGLVGTPRWMWAYELEHMFLRYPLEQIRTSAQHPMLNRLCSLGMSHQETWMACVEYLKSLPHGELLEVLEQLRERLPVELDEENRFLSWDEVRRLRDYGFEIGAHTESHPILPRLPLAEVERELSACRETLERELGTRPTLFAYPNGDTTPEITRLVGRYFEAAVTTRPGLCTATSPLLELPRIGAPNSVGDLAFQLMRERLQKEQALEEVRA